MTYHASQSQTPLLAEKGLQLSRHAPLPVRQENHRTTAASMTSVLNKRPEALAIEAPHASTVDETLPTPPPPPHNSRGTCCNVFFGHLIPSTTSRPCKRGVQAHLRKCQPLCMSIEHAGGMTNAVQKSIGQARDFGCDALDPCGGIIAPTTAPYVRDIFVNG